MKFEQLISVAKLGKRVDQNGYFTYKIFQQLPQRLDTLKEVFLIFKDNRVRFVDVEFSQTKIKIRDKIIRKEILSSGNVKIALSKNDIDDLRAINDQIPLSDMVLVHKQQIIGDLIDIFDNNAHEVLVIRLHSGKEIMIPNVEYYITGIEGNQIVAENIEDLLEL